jgi:hypothetical protein
MLFTYIGIITFMLIEWIKYKRDNPRKALNQQEVSYNALRQRHDVRSMSALEIMLVLVQTLI